MHIRETRKSIVLNHGVGISLTCTTNGKEKKTNNIAAATGSIDIGIRRTVLILQTYSNNDS